MSYVMRKPTFAHAVVTAQLICLYFHYIDSAIPLLPKSKIPTLLPSSVAAQSALCRTCHPGGNQEDRFSQDVAHL